MRKDIDIQVRFKSAVCSFEAAKAAKKAGMTCANTFYAYDVDGSINDGGWLEKVTGAEMYPAINEALAIGMLEDCKVDFEKVKIYEEDGKYIYEYQSVTTMGATFVDATVLFWIKYKK